MLLPEITGWEKIAYTRRREDILALKTVIPSEED